MPFRVAQFACISCGKRAKRYSLIDLYMISDHCCFSNYHSCAVVNEEILSDCRTRMNINSRLTVGVFRHNTRNNGNAESIENMRHTMNTDCRNTWIRKNNLIFTLRSRITVKRSLYIHRKITIDFRKLFKKFHADAFRPFISAVHQFLIFPVIFI